MVGDVETGEVQFFELREAAQRLQPFVGDEGVPQIEPAQFLQTFEALQALVAEGGVGQIEGFQVDERGQARLGNATLRTTHLFQLRQTGEIGKTLILNIHGR